MRKAILMLLLAVVSNSAMAEWVELDTGSDKTIAVYADPATIGKEGNMVKMLDMYDYKTVQVSEGIKPYRSVTDLWEYDCKEEKGRMLSFSAFSGNTGRGKTVFRYSDPGKWQSIPPGSKSAFLWKFACGKQSTGVRSNTPAIPPQPSVPDAPSAQTPLPASTGENTRATVNDAPVRPVEEEKPVKAEVADVSRNAAAIPPQPSVPDAPSAQTPSQASTGGNTRVVVNDTPTKPAEKENPLKADVVDGKNNAAADWVKVAEDSDQGLNVYVDPATITKNGNRVKMWNLLDLKMTKVNFEGKSYMSIKLQAEYDCEEVQERGLAVSFYSGNMGRGEIVSSYSDPLVWEPVLLGTNSEALWRFACEKR